MKKFTRFVFLMAMVAACGNVRVFAQPTVAAPVPPIYPPAKVISIHSDAFTNLPNTNFFTGELIVTTSSEVQIAGVNTLKYISMDTLNNVFKETVNALPMNYLHIDVWTDNETSIHLIPFSRSTGGTGVFALTPLTLNAWTSFDIPLSYFTNQGMNISDLYKIMYTASGNSTFYFENIYFYNTTTTVDVSPPNTLTAVKGRVDQDAVELLLNATDDSGSVNYEITYGATTLKTGGVSGVQKSFQVTSLAASTDYSFSITVKDPTGNVGSSGPVVVTATTLPPFPGAPVPSFPASKVISIYSDTYTPIVNSINFNTLWGQNTIESPVQMSGNNALKLSNLDYQGVEFGAVVNAKTMNKVHIDVYDVDETSLRISPMCNCPREHLVSLSPLNLNAWNSFDVLLTQFLTVGMPRLYEFKIAGSGGKTVYVDNLYFFNDVNSGIATMDAINPVTCYPSQVKDRLTVNATSSIGQVIIRNLLGQSVKSIPGGFDEKIIDLGDLTAGNYFITVKLVNGLLVTQKIIKL